MYLGQVLKKMGLKAHTVLLHIKPLYIENTETGDWDRLSSDEVSDEFPNRGIVTWFNYPADTVEGSIWQFYILEQRYDPENEWHDAYKVNTFFPITSPVEIIDVRYLKTVENARVRLSNDGLGFNFCPSQKAYLWVNERIWVGPVQLSPSHEEGYWYLDKKQREHPLKVFSPAYNEMVELDIDGRRWFLKKGAKIGAHRGSVDWGEDEAVLRYALTKAQSEYAHAFTLTKKTITQMLGDLNFNESSMLEEDLGAYRLQRAKNIVEILDQRQSLVQELEASLLNLNVVRALIEEEKNRVRKEVEERVRDEALSVISEAEAKVEEVREAEYAIRQTIEAKNQEIERLQQDINAQQQHLQELEVDIQAKQQEQESLVESLDDTIAERLLTVMEQPQQFLAEIAVIKAALNLVPSAGAHQTLHVQQELALKNNQIVPVPVSSSPLFQARDFSSQVTILTDLEELRKNSVKGWVPMVWKQLALYH